MDDLRCNHTVCRNCGGHNDDPRTAHAPIHPFKGDGTGMCQIVDAPENAHHGWTVED